MTRFAILLLLPAAALADTITITVLSQTTEAMAFNGSFPLYDCLASNPTSAQCVTERPLPGGSNTLIENAIATVSAAGEVSVGAVTSYGYAGSSASVTESVLITGESGTGYVALPDAVAVGSGYPFSTFGYISIGVNYVGFPAIQSYPAQFAVFSFPFNAPFTLSYGLATSIDEQFNYSSGGSFGVTSPLYFTTSPTTCQYNGTVQCPGDTPLTVNGLLVPPINITAVPEPSTCSIVLASMSLMPFTLAINPTRRWLRHILPT